MPQLKELCEISPLLDLLEVFVLYDAQELKFSIFFYDDIHYSKINSNP